MYVEPIDCHFGTLLKEVTRCFLEQSDLIPGIVKDTRGTSCDARRCEVVYVTAVTVKDSLVVQMLSLTEQAN